MILLHLIAFLLEIITRLAILSCILLVIQTMPNEKNTPNPKLQKGKRLSIPLLPSEQGFLL